MSDEHVSIPVARALLEIGAVGFTPHQPVTFKSGIRAPVYVDNRRLIYYPDQWHIVVNEFVSRLIYSGMVADVIAGVETSGIPHSSALAYATEKPSVFVRKQEKGHGLRRRIEGGDVVGQHVLLIEDMVTTGESSLAAIHSLRESGATVTDCYAIITYGFPDAYKRFKQENVYLSTLTNFAAVLEEAIVSGRIRVEDAQIIRQWMDDPYEWSQRHS